MSWAIRTTRYVAKDLAWALLPAALGAALFSALLGLVPAATGAKVSDQDLGLAVVSALVALAGLSLPRYRSASLRKWVRLRRAIAARLQGLVPALPMLRQQADLARAQAEYVAIELWLLDWYPFAMAVVAASLFIAQPTATVALVFVDLQLWLLAYVIRAAKQSEAFTIELARLDEEMQLVAELEDEARRRSRPGQAR